MQQQLKHSFLCSFSSYDVPPIILFIHYLYHSIFNRKKNKYSRYTVNVIHGNLIKTGYECCWNSCQGNGLWRAFHKKEDSHEGKARSVMFVPKGARHSRLVLITEALSLTSLWICIMSTKTFPSPSVVYFFLLKTWLESENLLWCRGFTFIHSKEILPFCCCVSLPSPSASLPSLLPAVN